jgi:hypothetical protein
MTSSFGRCRKPFSLAYSALSPHLLDFGLQAFNLTPQWLSRAHLQPPRGKFMPPRFDDSQTIAAVKSSDSKMESVGRWLATRRNATITPPGFAVRERLVVRLRTTLL